ncbi:Limonene 1,2-monooxygenase [Serratia rubidaea]|uniref:Limonene 1,2-monooxygenase n=1 Tax=Serratia rubidaea TaxID=61652 RepID=A0A447QR90_SERRU|nr:Limonene 1,2-monooxygenase [Serratia rubidaea]
MMELCEIADRGGVHTIWTGEHHGMNFTIAPNPFINLVDIAHRTQHARLGTGTVIAPFHHPVRLAGEAAMTDLITNGRLELGIARGAYSYEYERLMPGLTAWDAGQRMRELIPAVKKLWQGITPIRASTGLSRQPPRRRSRSSSRIHRSGWRRATRTATNSR